MMRVWLDDKRPMPAGFDVHTISATHAIRLLRVGLVDMISLDHDLGPTELYGTGYDVAKAIEGMCFSGHLKRRLTVYLHTQNVVGRSNMLKALQAAQRMSNRIELPAYDHPETEPGTES